MKNAKQIRDLAKEMLSMDWTIDQIEKMPDLLDGQDSDFEAVINCYYGTYDCDDDTALEMARACLESLAESKPDITAIPQGGDTYSIIIDGEFVEHRDADSSFGALEDYCIAKGEDIDDYDVTESD